jgi:signal transduction histidine kinase
MFRLGCTAKAFTLSVSDNGVGLSPEKLKELREKPHYMESTDDRLDLRHGLGLNIVRQVVEVHSGTVHFITTGQTGFSVELLFPQRKK